MTLAEFFEQHYLPIRLFDGSADTIRLYRTSIRLFGETLEREPLVEDLTDRLVARHLRRLIDDGYSRHTARKEQAQLRAIAGFAFRRGLIPWLELPTMRVPRPTPKAWSLVELRALLASCQAETLPVHGVPGGLWWTSLHLVLWDSGERIQGLLACEWGDLRDGRLIVRTRKLRGDEASYPLGSDTLAWLERARRPERRRIWPWWQSESNLYGSYDRILRRAELETDRQSKFHRMRRSFASHLAANGQNPTAHLRHADPRTIAHYLDPSIVRPAPTVLPRILPEERGAG